MFVCLFVWPQSFNLYGFWSLNPDSSEKSCSWCFERQMVGNVWEAYCLAFALLGKACVFSKTPYLFHLCLSLCLRSLNFSSWWVVCFCFFFFPSHWFDIIQITWFYSSFFPSFSSFFFYFSVYIFLYVLLSNSSNSKVN